jgi:hypothetical protein
MLRAPWDAEALPYFDDVMGPLVQLQSDAAGSLLFIPHLVIMLWYAANPED